MILRELVTELLNYNLEAEVTVVIDSKPYDFEICCGGAEGITPKTCDSVDFFVIPLEPDTCDIQCPKEVVNKCDDTVKSTQRKHAHWIKPSPYSESRCSNCYKPPKLLFGMLPDFCPWCGAEMDEQVQGE